MGVGSRRRGWTGAAAALAVVTAVGCRPPTYADHVARLLHEECTSCHRVDGPAPFPLQRYEDAASVAPALAAAVADGRMPPWLPAADGPAFEGERRLTRAEIRTLVRWAEAGAPAGDLARAPEPPAWPSGWALGAPDLVAEMAEPFPVPADGHEMFRNFVLPVPLDGPRWVSAVELQPGNPRVVHHATIRIDSSPASRLADARDSLPGFDDMFSHTGARPPGGFFLGWTPGRLPTPNPRGMAWLLEPGTDLVVQLHLRPTGRPERLSTSVGLHFTDTPPREVPLIIRLGAQTMDIPPGSAAYTVEDHFELPVAVRALGVYPHAHYLGKTMNAWAQTPGGDRVSLLEIPEWDFNWQDAYHYAEPVPLPAGSVLHMRYTFDNSADNPRNPSRPPRRVVYGPGSSDEMAELWLQVVPVQPHELDALTGALRRKDLTDRAEGWRHRLAVDSMDAEARFALGSAAQARGDLAAALTAYDRALEIEPDYAQALHNRGLIQEGLGDTLAALRSHEAAVAALQAYPAAWNDLGRLRAARGELVGALAALERAIGYDSTHVETQNNLGAALREAGRAAEAEDHFRAALRLRPDFAPARFNLALALVALGRAEEALLELNAGLEADRGNVQAALAVVWELATAADSGARSPDLAVDVADQIREQVSAVHPAVSDVQAAAHAAAGHFERAIELIDEGIAAAIEQIGRAHV